MAEELHWRRLYLAAAEGCSFKVVVVLCSPSSRLGPYGSSLLFSHQYAGVLNNISCASCEQVFCRVIGIRFLCTQHTAQVSLFYGVNSASSLFLIARRSSCRKKRTIYQPTWRKINLGFLKCLEFEGRKFLLDKLVVTVNQIWDINKRRELSNSFTLISHVASGNWTRMKIDCLWSAACRESWLQFKLIRVWNSIPWRDINQIPPIILC